MNDARDDLVAALQELRRKFPDFRFGQLVCTLTILARDDAPESVWEVEDDELLAAIRQMRTDGRESVGVAQQSASAATRPA